MQPQEINLNDWMRMLVGEVPAGFFIELFIRSIVIYLILLVSMRAMGKRMSSQLGRNELAALVSLAAAIGIPMMAPDRGILPGMVVAFILVTTERLIARQNTKSEKFEKFSQGNVSTLISDGVVNMDELYKSRLSHERVFAQLRAQGILQLGEIARFYMEADGTFTMVRNSNTVPGLCVLPPWDHPMRNYFREYPAIIICVQCGYPKHTKGQSHNTCPNCSAKKWVSAVKVISDKD